MFGVCGWLEWWGWLGQEKSYSGCPCWMAILRGPLMWTLCEAPRHESNGLYFFLSGPRFALSALYPLLSSCGLPASL